jgi:hypothetical protein
MIRQTRGLGLDKCCLRRAPGWVALYDEPMTQRLFHLTNKVAIMSDGN